MLKRLLPSMFDGNFDPKRLCLTWPVDCCIYAWHFSLCAYGALVLEALLSTLVLCCRRCCFVVVAIAQRNVLQNEPHPPVHERLVDNICCCCSRVVTIVAIAWRNMIVSRTCAQGLVLCWCFTQRNMKCTRPCHHQYCGTWRWKRHALAHEALLSLSSCNAMWKCIGWYEIEALCSCAMANAQPMFWSLHFGWESLCSCARWLWLMRLRRGCWLLLNHYRVIADCCLSNDDSQYKCSCACAWGAHCWHMMLSKLCLLLSPLRHTICK